jgi:hypothetical protein
MLRCLYYSQFRPLLLPVVTTGKGTVWARTVRLELAKHHFFPVQYAGERIRTVVLYDTERTWYLVSGVLFHGVSEVVSS